MSKYVTLDDFKQFSPTQIQNSNDDFALQAAVDWAEGTFESLTGSKFDQATETEEPLLTFVSNRGVMTLIAATRGPVTAVSSIQFKYPGETTWNTLAWGSDDLMLPPVSSPPDPNSWKVKVVPTNMLFKSIAAGVLLVKWTYTGGYAKPPEEIKFPLLRLAQWKYKLREAPLGRINSEMFGTREVIQDLPRDIAFDIMRWVRVVE